LHGLSSLKLLPSQPVSFATIVERRVSLSPCKSYVVVDYAFSFSNFVVKLICHKVALEVILKPFGEGSGFGESADQLQQFYGFIFFRDNPLVAHVPEKGLNTFQVPQKPPPVEL
jgi:hypothetical protein